MPFKQEAVKAVEEMRAADEQVDAIADEFLRGLAACLVDDKRRNMKNQGITPDFVKNANDYYDANMVMDAAFKKCGLQTFDADGQMTEATIELFNDAWERAVGKAERIVGL